MRICFGWDSSVEMARLLLTAPAENSIPPGRWDSSISLFLAVASCLRSSLSLSAVVLLDRAGTAAVSLLCFGGENRQLHLFTLFVLCRSTPFLHCFTILAIMAVGFEEDFFGSRVWFRNANVDPSF